MKPTRTLYSVVLALTGILLSRIADAQSPLEIDPTTRQQSANDPADWSGAITVRGSANWTAQVIPETADDDVSWLSITPVPPGFLAYGMTESFGAEARTALIEFTGGVRFKLVQSGRGATISSKTSNLARTILNIGPGELHIVFLYGPEGLDDFIREVQAEYWPGQD